MQAWESFLKPPNSLVEPWRLLLKSFAVCSPRARDYWTSEMEDLIPVQVNWLWPDGKYEVLWMKSGIWKSH